MKYTVFLLAATMLLAISCHNVNSQTQMTDNLQEPTATSISSTSESAARRNNAGAKIIFRKVLEISEKSVFLPPISSTRSVSSVGLERLLDRQEVTGSNPVQITEKEKVAINATFFYFLIFRAFSAAR